MVKRQKTYIGKVEFSMKIIDDQSPFYIVFTFEGIANYAEWVMSFHNNFQYSIKNQGTYEHLLYSDRDILTKLYEIDSRFTEFDIDDKRISLVRTFPGGKSSIHKDGIACGTNLNMIVEKSDDLCLTSWYDDFNFAGLSPWGYPYTRAIVSKYSDQTSFKPSKTVVLHKYQMILFNTDIWHGWNNSGTNIRSILNFKFLKNPDFTQCKKKLLEICSGK